MASPPAPTWMTSCVHAEDPAFCEIFSHDVRAQPRRSHWLKHSFEQAKPLRLSASRNQLLGTFPRTSSIKNLRAAHRFFEALVLDEHRAFDFLECGPDR